VDAGITSVRASEMEIPKSDLTTTKMRAGFNQSTPEPQEEPHLDGRSTPPVDERNPD